METVAHGQPWALAESRLGASKDVGAEESIITWWRTALSSERVTVSSSLVRVELRVFPCLALIFEQSEHWFR
jgi:hypothetical protein